jgi:EAL domain-containing protein (putative c-di-GMP-specific phosphodiesterase class I)
MSANLALVEYEVAIPPVVNRFSESADIFFVYQPIFDVMRHEPCAYEALVRSNSMSTSELLDGVNSEIDRKDFLDFTLKQTLLSFKKTNLKSKLSINCSQPDLAQPWFTTTVLNAIEAADFNPEQLIIELTEHEAIFNHNLTVKTLEEMSRNKIGIALDDFGVRNCNMEALCFLPITEIKIDGKFIRNLSNHKCLHWLEQMVSFTNKIGIELVVEMVETRAQVRQLSNLGVHLMQGFYFAEGTAEIESNNLTTKIYGESIADNKPNHNAFVNSVGLARGVLK